MSIAETTHDIFLSASPLDRGVAEVVRRAFEARGLTVFLESETLKVGGPSEDAIHSAMADCRAFVAILSRPSMNSAWFTVELGAAWAWDKPIYLLLEGIDGDDLPPYLSRYRAIPIARLGDAIPEIERRIEPLSDEQAEALGGLYETAGLPIDQLWARPQALDQLTNDFNRRWGTALPAGRILQELTRLRKQARLPRPKRGAGTD